MHLFCKDWRRLAQTALQKCLNGQVIAIFARSPKSRIFWKSAKGGPREIFKKSPKKKPSFERTKSTLAQMALSSNSLVLKAQRLEKILGQKSGSKSTRMAKLWQFSQGHPNPAFFKKCERGTKGTFSKIVQKVALVRKAQKTLAQMALSSN